MTDLSGMCLGLESTLRDTMVCINQNAKGIALIVDGSGRLLYTITDGDLRRAVLHRLPLDMTVADWEARIAQYAREARTQPTAPEQSPLVTPGVGEQGNGNATVRTKTTKRAPTAARK